MVRHILLLIVLSVFAVFCMPVLSWLFHVLIYLHAAFLHLLKGIFANDRLGNRICEAISLIVIPMLIAAIPALIYWLVTHRSSSYFYFLAWGTWLVLVVVLAVH